MKKKFITLFILAHFAISFNLQKSIAASIFETQNPIIVSGYMSRAEMRMDREVRSRLFIQEQASIAISGTMRTMRLTEESAQKIGSDRIGIISVNGVGWLWSEEEQVTLEVFPIDTKELQEFHPFSNETWRDWDIRNNTFLSKNIVHREDSVRMRLTRGRVEREREVIRFFENLPMQGDTIETSIRGLGIDSRFTPLLIQNLTNDSEFYTRHHSHAHGWDADGTPQTVGLTIYFPNRISDFVRGHLQRIFAPANWSFVTPRRDATVEEWQAWFEDLLNPDTELIMRE